MPTSPRANWAGNLTYSSPQLYTPESIEELQDIVRKSAHIRALGTRHSFNAIADSAVSQVSTSELNRIISLDKISHTITVEGGIKYGELCTYLDSNGYALHNLASLPHISVAGACSTATHGSGIKNKSLASAVSAIEFVNGAGDIVSLSRKKNADAFTGAVVGLGATGVITKMTLDLLPSFAMKQTVYQDMPMAELEKDFEAIMGSGYSVSLFTDWRNKNINQIWVKASTGTSTGSVQASAGSVQASAGSVQASTSAATAEPAWNWKGLPASTNLHPLQDLSAEHCTEQLSIPGCWYDRLPHFKMGFTPSSGKELQSEYFIAIENAYAGMMAIEKLNAKVSPHLFISEIRTIAADDFWMSPFYKKTCVAFHFTWKQEWGEVQLLLPLIEEALAPFSPKPHWGKLFTMNPRVLQSRIERLDDFRELLSQYDPAGKFRNDFIGTYLY